jgi:hypothetical protein
MKHGIKTTEFWSYVGLSSAIFYFGLTARIEAKSAVDWLVTLWFAYTGYRGWHKTKPEITDPPNENSHRSQSPRTERSP